jgi:hypothetical protein
MSYSLQPRTHNPFSTSHHPFSTTPPLSTSPDIPQDVDVHLIECYHEVAHGTSCDQCTPPMRRRCFERVTAAINAARSNFKYKCKVELEFEENLLPTTEPFDEYTCELVVRLPPPRLSYFEPRNCADARARRSHGTVLVLRYVLFSCTRGGCGGVRILLITGWQGPVGGEFGARCLVR